MLHPLQCSLKQLQIYALPLAQTEREAARIQLRTQCAQQLNAHYSDNDDSSKGRDWQANDISNIRGQAPKILPVQGKPPLALSFSYEGAWAAFAWHEGPALGIDLFCLSVSDWQKQPQHWQQLCHDYLGSAQAHHIFSLPKHEQAHAFALAWSAHEAALKCLQQPLQEWCPTLAAEIAQLRMGICPALPQFSHAAEHIWTLAWTLPQNSRV